MVGSSASAPQTNPRIDAAGFDDPDAGPVEEDEHEEEVGLFSEPPELLLPDVSTEIAALPTTRPPSNAAAPTSTHFVVPAPSSRLGVVLARIRHRIAIDNSGRSQNSTFES
eukprot:6429634-Karenia_brevis.AAC.1